MFTKNFNEYRRRFFSRSANLRWIGAETKTWAPLGSFIGGTMGLIIGVGMAVAFWDKPASYLLPILGLFFGIFAGVLVGNGTPKFKAHPDQGHLDRVSAK